MLNKRKILGLIKCEPLTISQIVTYTNLKESVVNKVINQLLKEGKIEWA